MGKKEKNPKEKKKIKSQRVRIYFYLWWIAIIPLLATTGFMGYLSYQEIFLSRSEDMAEQLRLVGAHISVVDLKNQNISEEAVYGVNLLSSLYKGRILVIDQDYKVVIDTYGIDDGKTVISRNVFKAFQGQESRNFTEEGALVNIVVPIQSPEDGVIGVMNASISQETREGQIKNLLEMMGLGLGVLLIIIFIVIFPMSKSLVKPLLEMRKSAKKILSGSREEMDPSESYKETVEIATLYNRLLEKNKNIEDSRMDFVSDVAHELKTPMTSVKVLADSLLMSQSSDIEMYREFMLDITEEIDRENKIINDLLELIKVDGRAARLNIQLIHINDMIEDILKRLKPLADKRKIKLVLESFREVEAEVDEIRMTSVVTNLVENAIKYNKDEGYVHVSLNADSTYMYIKVQDSGIGIPKEDQEAIFQRFYRVDKSRSREIGGTGLGLSIAHSIVQLHQGTIKVFSEEEEGTTFSVRIPLTYIS